MKLIDKRQKNVEDIREMKPGTLFINAINELMMVVQTLGTAERGYLHIESGAVYPAEEFYESKSSNGNTKFSTVGATIVVRERKDKN